MDFSAPDVKLPHGGNSVRNIDEATELEVNKTFAQASSRILDPGCALFTPCRAPCSPYQPIPLFSL